MPMKLISNLNKQLLIFIILIIWIFSLFITGPAHPFDEQPEGKVSETVNAGLQHLLDLADPSRPINFDPRLVAPVLDFVEASKSNGIVYHSNIVPNLSSAYYDFDVQKSLKTIMDYAFNPDIPAIATMPSSARLVNWNNSGSDQRKFPRMSRLLAGDSAPVEIKGGNLLKLHRI